MIPARELFVAAFGTFARLELVDTDCASLGLSMEPPVEAEAHPGVWERGAEAGRQFGAALTALDPGADERTSPDALRHAANLMADGLGLP